MTTVCVTGYVQDDKFHRGCSHHHKYIHRSTQTTKCTCICNIYRSSNVYAMWSKKIW